MDILVGLLILGAVLLGAYVVTHHKPPVTASARDLADTVGAAASESWEAIKRDLPQIVSAEVAQLRSDLSAALERARAAEAALVAEQQARQASLAAVRDQVSAVIAGIGAQPASALAEAAPAP